MNYSETPVPTTGMRQLGEAIESAMARDAGFGRIILAGGGPGTGKSTAGHAVVRAYGGAFTTVGEIDGAKSLLSNLACALAGWTVRLATTAKYFDYCVATLRKRGERDWFAEEFGIERPRQSPLVVFDEADRLMERKSAYDLLQVVRDIHDASGATIVLISVRKLAKRLATPAVYDQTVTTRIAATVMFNPPTIEDAELLAAARVSGIGLEQDLIRHCLECAGGSLRTLLGLFDEIGAVAGAAELRRVTLSQWLELKSLAGLSPGSIKSARRKPKTISAVVEQAGARLMM